MSTSCMRTPCVSCWAENRNVMSKSELANTGFWPTESTSIWGCRYLWCDMKFLILCTFVWHITYLAVCIFLRESSSLLTENLWGKASSVGKAAVWNTGSGPAAAHADWATACIEPCSGKNHQCKCCNPVHKWIFTISMIINGRSFNYLEGYSIQRSFCLQSLQI